MLSTLAVNNTMQLNATTLYSNLNVSGSTFILGSTTIGNTLTIKNNTIIFNNMYISQPTIMNAPSTIGSNLNCNNMNINVLKIPDITPTGNLILQGNKINLGLPNSIINILATTTYVATQNLNIKDKIFELNINASTLSAFDIGDLSGFEILGTTNTGFMKTTTDAKRYQIKAPNDPNTNYILTLDLNNNIIISGTTTIQNNGYVNLNLTGSNISNFNNVTINSNLYVFDKAITTSLIKNNNSLLYIKNNKS